MRQSRVLASAAFTVFALAVVVSSAAAQGLPTAEPTSKENTTDMISVTAPKIVLTNKNTIECTTATTATSSETESPAASGEFHITFKGCVGTVSGIKSKCTGLADENEGEILSLGKYQDVYDTGGTELGVAIRFVVNPTHFTCAGLFLQVMEGLQLCLNKEPYVSKTLHEMVCEQKEGKQTETYLNDAAAVLTPKLFVTEGEKSQIEVAWEAKALLLALNKSKANEATRFKMN